MNNLVPIRLTTNMFGTAIMWTDGNGDALFCASAISEHVTVPARRTDLIVAFYPRAKQYGFKFEENTQHGAGPFIICGTKRVALYQALDNVFRKQLAQGNQYFRFEYR